YPEIKLYGFKISFLHSTAIPYLNLSTGVIIKPKFIGGIEIEGIFMLIQSLIVPVIVCCGILYQHVPFSSRLITEGVLDTIRHMSSNRIGRKAPIHIYAVCKLMTTQQLIDKQLCLGESPPLH